MRDLADNALITATALTDDAALAPTLDNTDPTYFVYTYTRTDEANADSNTTLAVQYSSDLVNWTTAVDDGTNVIITETDNGATDTVEVKIARSLAASGQLFARLNVVVATP